MKKLLSLLLVSGLALALAGCEATVTFPTGKSSKEEVWVGCLDAVSNYLHVNRADWEKGIIEARSMGEWERNLAKVQIQPRANQYDVTVGVYVETSTILMRPSGLRAGEEEHLSDLNLTLRDTLVKEIKQRLGVQTQRLTWRARPAVQTPPAAPPKSKAPKVETPKPPTKKEAAPDKKPVNK